MNVINMYCIARTLSHLYSLVLVIIVIVLNNKIPNNNLINIMITAAEGSSGTGERLRFCVKENNTNA